MKLAGLLLLVAGWALILSAIALLDSAVSQSVFVLAGLGVEAMGLVLAFRSHQVAHGDRS